MPPRKKKGTGGIRIPPPGPDPHGMETLLSAHIEWMVTRNFSGDTVRGRIYELGYFVRWCAEHPGASWPVLTEGADETPPRLNGGAGRAPERVRA